AVHQPELEDAEEESQEDGRDEHRLQQGSAALARAPVPRTAVESHRVKVTIGGNSSGGGFDPTSMTSIVTWFTSAWSTGNSRVQSPSRSVTHSVNCSIVSLSRSRARTGMPSA